MRSRSRTWLTAACISAIGLLSAQAQAPDLSKMDIVLRAVPDGPIAAVNGKSVSRADYVLLYTNEITMMQRYGEKEISDADRVRTGMRCVMMLVEREILLQDADKRKVVIAKDELEKEWQKELKRLQTVLAKTSGKDQTEEEILAKAGTTKEEALKDLEKSVRIDRVRELVIKEAGIAVSDAEIEKFYGDNKEQAQLPEQIHLKQIYLRDVQNSSKPDLAKRDAARKRAEDALKRIQSGQKFEAVCRAVSDGKYKEDGGDFGMLLASQLPPFLVEVAAELKPGEVSGLIESEFGIHIIMLVESTEGKTVSLEEAKPVIRKRLMGDRGEKAVFDYCKKIADNSDSVKVFLDLEKHLAHRPDVLDALKK